MSLLNVWVSPARALVAVDTLCNVGASATIHASKLLVLPHANLVLAGRGDLVMFAALVNQVQLQSESVDIDTLAARIAGMLDSAVAARNEYATKLGHGCSFEAGEYVLVGWSKSQNRVIGIACERLQGERYARCYPIEPWRIAPDAEWENPPPVHSVAAMETVARQQVAFQREVLPSAAIGGQLHVAHIMRDAITVTRVCSLED